MFIKNHRLRRRLAKAFWMFILIGMLSALQGLTPAPVFAAEPIARFGKGTLSLQSRHLAWSPDGKSIAVADATVIWVWDVATRTVRTRLKPPEGSAKDTTVTFGALAWSPDSRFLVVIDAGLTVWNVNQAAIAKTLPAFGDHAYLDVAWNPHRGQIAAIDSGAMLFGWNTENWQSLYRLDGAAIQAVSLAWSADGRALACGGRDGVVRLLDPAGQITRITTPGYGVVGAYWPVQEVAWTPDSKTVLGAVTQGDNRGETSVWNVVDGLKTNHLPLGRHLTWQPTGRLLALVPESGDDPPPDEDSTIQILDARGLVVTTLVHGAAVDDLWWSPDGKQIASLSRGEVSIWQVPS